MTPGEIMKLNEQVIEAWNRHDDKSFLAVCDEKIVWSINYEQEKFSGTEEVKNYFNTWQEAFPDLLIQVRTRVLSIDKITVEYVFTGTHKGNLRLSSELPEISATGKKVMFSGCYIARFKNFLVTEVSNYPDRLALIGQLGVIPELQQQIV
ncbi:MAG: ester cyclase [Bacteroidia bacterium]|nr:ester cyclase [Bacteroidia bacterium]